MTCIIAYKNKNGDIVLAGDKLGSNSFNSTTVKEPKVFKKKDFMIGYTSSFRMGQILMHLWNPPLRKIEQSSTNYLYADIVPSLIKVFKDNGFGKDNKYGVFILVYDGSIYEVQGEMSLLESERTVTSVGSGEYHATAAVQVLLKYEDDDKKILKKAYEIVSDNIVSVSRKFDFITNTK